MKPEDLNAGLPAPRDDEPESLRADIVDELADHLQCAVRREELRSNQETSTTEPRGLSPWPNQRSNEETNPRRSPVYQRVLARFGDPAAVARKLWWDAMWEKIMGQRILTLLAVAACCTMAFLTWQMLTQMQGMQRDLLAESQAQNTRLLEQFQALVGEIRDDAENAAPAEWVPLTVQCTFDSEDGPPAAGVKVAFHGVGDQTKQIPGDVQTSDDNGMIDFGKVLYGYYGLSCEMPIGILTIPHVSLRPGQEKTVTIVCPSAPPSPGEVKFDIEPPEGLRSAPMYYLAVVNGAGHVVNNHYWDVDLTAIDAPVYVLGAEGNLLGELDAELSAAFREESQRRRRDAYSALVDSLYHAPLSPSIERPEYRWRGIILALMAEPGDSIETAENRLPKLRLLATGDSDDYSFFTDPKSRLLRLSGSHAPAFWRQVAKLVARERPHGG